MHFEKLIVATVFILGSVLATGCSSDDGNKLEDTVGDLSEYGPASCAYGFEEGSTATPFANSDVRNTYFGKRLNFNLLDPVLSASGAETIRFAETNRVRFYKTTFKDSKNCEFAQALPMAPQDLSSEMRRVDKEGSILGLYLPARTPDLPSVRDQAAILVKRDTNKWVLVHEFMHHLYKIQKDADTGIATVDIKTRFIRLDEEFEASMKSLKSASTKEHPAKLRATAAKLAELNTAATELLHEYFLEEMAIETVLGEKHEQGRLKYVLEGQRLNGAVYSIGSAEKAQLLIIKPLVKQTKLFKAIYSDLSLEDVRSLEQNLETFSKLEWDISVVKAKAQAYIKSKGYKIRDINGIRGLSQSSPKPSCSHQRDADEVIQILNRGS